MPYTRITPTRNGREAIEYAMNGEAHDGKGERNVLVGAVGMAYDETADGYAEQMEPFWRLASSRNKTQIRRIITSYSKEELDPEDPKSAEIALAVAMEHAETAYPGRQALICVQRDGRGGCLHVHELVSNDSMIDNSGCTNEQTKFSYVAQTVNEVAKKYLEISMEYSDRFDELGRRKQQGKSVGDAYTQNERRMRGQNAEAEAQGEAPANYVWKDDLKERVRAAMGEAADRDDFLKRLTAHGVEGEFRVSKKQGEYIIYELSDVTGFGDGKIPANLKSKSYKLGGDYGLEALDAALQMRKPEPKPVWEPKTRFEPEPVAQKTAEDLEADRKRQEEAERFVAWCAENGYQTAGKDGVFDIDLFTAAQDAYRKAQEARRAVQQPQGYQDTPEPSGRRQRAGESGQTARKRAEGEDSGQRESTKEKTEGKQEPQAPEQPLRSELIRKLMDDAARLEAEARDYDEDEEGYTPV